MRKPFKIISVLTSISAIWVDGNDYQGFKPLIFLQSAVHITYLSGHLWNSSYVSKAVPHFPSCSWCLY